MQLILYAYTICVSSFDYLEVYLYVFMYVRTLDCMSAWLSQWLQAIILL